MATKKKKLLTSDPYKPQPDGRGDARALINAHHITTDVGRLKGALGALGDLHEEASRDMMAAKAASGLKKAFPSDKKGLLKATTSKNQVTSASAAKESVGKKRKS